MQSQQVQLVKEAWGDAFNRRDASRFANLHTASVVFHDPTVPQPIRGRTDLERWFDGLFKMFPDCRLEIGRVYGMGEWVCVECVESGTMKGPIKHPKGDVPPTGKSYRISAVLVCKVEGRNIAEVRAFYDVVDLMSQLGLQA